jgi:hypothetical protein
LTNVCGKPNSLQIRSQVSEPIKQGGGLLHIELVPFGIQHVDAVFPMLLERPELHHSQTTLDSGTR